MYSGRERVAEQASMGAAVRVPMPISHLFASEPRVMRTVSVVVPSYNKAAFIAETLRSALAQTGVRLEVIVVDDASTDGSGDVIERLADGAPALRLDRLATNRGGQFARNHGASLATGEYLMFLDADDILEPGTLEALVRTLGDRTDAFGVCRWSQLVQNEAGQWTPHATGKPIVPADGDYVRAWLTDNWYFPPCAVLWPRALYERSGGWDERLRILQDADIMVRMLLRGAELVLATEGEARYRVHEAHGSVSKMTSAASVLSRMHFLENAAQTAAAAGVGRRYAQSIGRAYYRLAMQHATPYPELLFECLRRADQFGRRTPYAGSRMHRALWRLLGAERKERVTRWLCSRRLVRRTTGPGREGSPS